MTVLMKLRRVTGSIYAYRAECRPAQNRLSMAKGIRTQEVLQWRSKEKEGTKRQQESHRQGQPAPDRREADRHETNAEQTPTRLWPCDELQRKPSPDRLCVDDLL